MRDKPRGIHFQKWTVLSCFSSYSACGGNFEDFSSFLFLSSSCYNFSSHLGP